MKTFLLLLFNIISINAFAQLETRVKWFPVAASSASDTIYYNPSQKLVWKDFKGRADNNSEAIAVTFSGFGYAMRFESKGSKTVLDITVYCFFNRKQSWSKTAMQSDYALLHEQHHFDITFIAASLFVRKLRETHFTADNYEELIDQLYTETYKEMNRMQDQYDTETRNGRTRWAQEDWNDKIEAQVKGLEVK